MNKKNSDQPIRTCISCRNHFAKAVLERYVWESETGDIVLDGQHIMSGRGAYCCKNETCRKRFFARKQGWKKAFRLH